MALFSPAKRLPTILLGLPADVKASYDPSMNGDQTKGEVVLVKDMRFAQYVGEPHPFEYPLTNELYCHHPFVAGVVDKIVDWAWGPGFYTKSDDSRAKDIIDQWLDDTNFQLVGRKWFRQALIKGFSPLELGGKIGQVPQGVKVLNADNVFIMRDKTGKITGVNQLRPGARIGGKDSIIPFDPRQIIILTINQIDDMPYGYGIIYPCMKAINNLLAAEIDMHKLMKRKANQPIVATMGSPEVPPTQESLDDFSNKLTYMNNKTEWAVSADVKMEVLDFGDIGAKFESILQHDTDMLFFGFQIPEVIMGRGNIPEGLAKAQTEGFDRYIRSKQLELGMAIEQIFERILYANGFDTDVEIVWGEPTESEANNTISQLTTLLGNGLLTPKMREEIEKKLAKLLDINEKDILTSRRERQAELTNPQPAVPVRKKQAFHEQLVLETPLKEWLGFNYLGYLNSIKQVISKERFIDLRADSPEEVKQGYLTEQQVKKLKVVLKNNFEKGQTIKAIAKDIETQVKLKELKRYDSEGELTSTIAVTERSISIARTETTRMANAGAQLHYQDNGVQEYAWISSMSDRTCPDCAMMNGKVFNIQSTELPPLHPLCRCSISAVLPK